MVLNLEKSLGTQLFIRNKRDVRLTYAGRVFYEEIKKTLRLYDKAVLKVKNLHSHIREVITIGILGTTLLHIFPEIMERCQKEFPDIKLNPMDYPYDVLMQKLHNGDIDIAIFPDFVKDVQKGIIKREIYTDPICVVLHESHPLSEAGSLSVSQIVEEPLIHMHPQYSQTDYDIINNIFTLQGYVPNTVYEASSLLNLLLMADCKIGITLLAKHMKQFAAPTLRFIPLAGYENYFRVTYAYNPNQGGRIEEILGILRQSIPANTASTI